MELLIVATILTAVLAGVLSVEHKRQVRRRAIIHRLSEAARTERYELRARVK